MMRTMRNILKANIVKVIVRNAWQQALVVFGKSQLIMTGNTW